MSSKGLRHQPRQVHNPGMQRSVHSGWVRAITSTCVRCAEIHLTSGRGHHCCLLVQGSGHTDVRREGEGSELSQFSCSAGDDAVGGKEGWGRKLLGALSPHRGPMQTASLWWINIRWRESSLSVCTLQNETSWRSCRVAGGPLWARVECGRRRGRREHLPSWRSFHWRCSTRRRGQPHSHADRLQWVHQPIDMAKMYQMGSLAGVVMRKNNSWPFLERSPRRRYPPTSNPSPRRMTWRLCPLPAGKDR